MNQEVKEFSRTKEQKQSRKKFVLKNIARKKYQKQLEESRNIISKLGSPKSEIKKKKQGNYSKIRFLIKW